MSKKKKNRYAFAKELQKVQEEAQRNSQALDELINESKLHFSSKYKASSSSNNRQGSTEDQKKKKKKKKKDPEKEEIEEYEEDPKTRTRERSQKSEEGNSERHEHDNEGHKSKGKRKKSKRKSKRKEENKRKEEENNERREEENNERKEEENNERKEEENNERKEEENYEREEENYEREEENYEGEEGNNEGEEERDMEVVRAFECAKEPLKMIETVKKPGIKFLFHKQATKKNEQMVNRQMFVEQDTKENKQIVNRQMFVRRRKKDLTQSTFSDEQNENGSEDDAHAECSHEDSQTFEKISPRGNIYSPDDFPIYGCMYIYKGLCQAKLICSKTSLDENNECISSDAGINEFVPRNERVLFLCAACAVSTVKFEWFKYKKDIGKEIIKEEFKDTAPPTYFVYSQFFVENFGDQHQGEYHCRISCGVISVDCSVKIFMHLLDHMNYLSPMALRELGIENRPSSTFGISYQYLSSVSDNEHEEDSSSDEKNSDQSSESDKYDSPMYGMYKAMYEAKCSSESTHYEKVKTDLEPIEGEVSLWVSGLSNQTRGYELVSLFSYQGELYDVTIVEDSSVSPPERFAYVRMASEDDAQNCIDMSVELEAEEGYLVRKCEKEEEEAVKQCVREAALRDLTLDLLDERNDWKIFSAHNGIKLLHKDILTLFHQNWLNDEVIDFYLHLIVERSKQHLYPSVYAFGTSFYPKLRKGYYFVNSWTNGINVFAYDIIMMPVVSNIYRGLAVIDFRSKKIKLYDPLNVLDSCFVMLRDYITRESVDKKRKYIDLTDWSYDNVENIPKLTENTSYDCGVFLLKYAECISRDVTEMTFKPANATNYRLHMAYEIYTKQIL